MKTVKKIRACILIIAIMAGMVLGCGKSNESENPEDVANQAAGNSADVEINIVYTNDVHSYVENVVTDEDGNVTGNGLRLSNIAAMVNDMRAEGKNVLLVDAGDEIQGDIYGAMDEGETVIKIMKETGYQLATPGNHDFDYGMLRFLKLAENAGFPYVSCNFHPARNTEIIFTPSYTFDVAGKKVAFIGVTTPETITSSTPVYFQDENGDYIYIIDGLKNKEDLYTSVQSAIDNVRDKADYVIGLGHLGVGMSAEKRGWDSKSVIANVTGLDAFIDGHSHTTMERETVTDKEGKEVILTQTGSYLNAVGVMTITADGTISTKLVNEYNREEEKIAQMEKDWEAAIDSNMNEKIGMLENTLYINNPDNESQRLIRSQELNMGDFTADSVYWFFNERLGIDCDVVLQNSGGIRSEIKKGDMTYLTVKKVNPFGDMVCLVSASGQQIIDALEMGATVIGEWDEEWNEPAENGGFMQVAGLTYTIDASIPSSVELDDNGMFLRVNGEYRVKDVKIYNKATGQYEDIDPAKHYQLGGINYLLRNSGVGLSMFEEDELSADYVGLDYVILAEYIKSFGIEGEYATVNNATCPLRGYEGYLLDYENPYGAGRINIIKK